MLSMFTAALCAAAIALAIAPNEAAAQQAPTSTYIPDGYSIVTVPTPEGAVFAATGLDVNAAGDIAVATRFGEVWVLPADKADDDIAADDWQLFAEGLSEPTGLLYDLDGTILVAQKPELTRLVDANGDGGADEYIAFAAGWEFHDNYHEYNFGPVRDAQGNFYGTLNTSHNDPEGFSKNNNGMRSGGGLRGWAYKVAPDGTFSPFAYGLRSPAGVGLGPDGLIYYTDNQGDWMETSPIFVLREDRFYGHPSSLRDHPDFTMEQIDAMSVEELEAMRELPAIWVPYREVGNSPGNPDWDETGGKFGPFSGQMFIGDQTQSNVFRAISEEVDGQIQGAVINFANSFQSGNIRTVFDHKGRLWVGQTQRGWGATGGEPYGLEILQWDGETMPFELLDISIVDGGFAITFTEPVAAASRDGAFSASQWNYEYGPRYGSLKHNEADVAVTGAVWSDDGRMVTLSMPLETGKVVAIDFAALRDGDGRAPTSAKVFYTINRLRN